MMTIFNLQDQAAYYEADDAFLVIAVQNNAIKEIYGLFESQKDARRFAVEFGNNNESIRVMPIPFLRRRNE